MPTNLMEWQIKPLGERVLIVPDRKNGYPMVHRADCKTGPSQDHPSVPPWLVEDLWLAETYRRNMLREKKIEFCEVCLCEEKSAT